MIWSNYLASNVDTDIGYLVRILGDDGFLEEKPFEVGDGVGFDGFAEVGLAELKVDDLLDLTVEDFVFIFELKGSVGDFFFEVVDVLFHLFLIQGVDIGEGPVLVLSRVLVKILHD